MTPTLDELIDYQTTIADYWHDLPDSRDALLNRGILTALQRLRAVEATVKDSLTVQATTEQSSAVPPTVTESLTVQPPTEESSATDATIRNFRTTQPRPGVPTVEEVGDDAYCWVYAPEEDEIWPTYHRYTGEQIRRWPDHGTHWLPYDAIPMPEGHE